MLRQWIMGKGQLDSIHIEEKYRQWVESLRTDRYVTARGLPRVDTPCELEVTVFQLEKIYGRSSDAKSFIKDLCAGAFFLF